MVTGIKKLEWGAKQKGTVLELQKQNLSWFMTNTGFLNTVATQRSQTNKFYKYKKSVTTKTPLRNLLDCDVTKEDVSHSHVATISDSAQNKDNNYNNKHTHYSQSMILHSYSDQFVHEIII